MSYWKHRAGMCNWCGDFIFSGSIPVRLRKNVLRFYCCDAHMRMDSWAYWFVIIAFIASMIAVFWILLTGES